MPLETKSILDAIKYALEPLGYPIYYGTAAGISKSQPWDYIVFGRENATGNNNNTSLTHHYTVAVIHEDYVPEDTIKDVLDAMLAIPGMRWAGEIVFDYMAKPGTTDVVELMVVRFDRPQKL